METDMPIGNQQPQKFKGKVAGDLTEKDVTRKVTFIQGCIQRKWAKKEWSAAFPPTEWGYALKLRCAKHFEVAGFDVDMCEGQVVNRLLLRRPEPKPLDSQSLLDEIEWLKAHLSGSK